MGLAYLVILFGIPLALFENLFYDVFQVIALPFMLAEDAFYKIGELFKK